MKKVSFDTLPTAIEELCVKLERIEAVLFSPKSEIITSDTMLLDEALEFLKQNGRPTSRATIYKETSLGWIPFKRLGKRLVFSRKDLKSWLDDGMPKTSSMRAIDKLSERMDLRFTNPKLESNER